MTDLLVLKNNADSGDDFIYSNSLGKQPNLFRSAKYLLVPLSIFQVIYALTGSDPFLWRNLLNSSLSLAVTFLVIAWAKTAGNIIQYGRLLNSQNVFIGLVIACIQHIVFAFELTATRSFGNDLLQANVNEDLLAEKITTEGHWQQLLMITQVIITLAFLVSARIVYKSLDNTQKTVGYALCAAAVLVSASAFTAIFYASSSSYFLDIPEIAAQYSTTLSNWITIFGLLFVLVSLAAFVIHHKQWKGVAPVLAVTLGALIVVGVPLAGNSYQNSLNIKQDWSETGPNWVNRMANVSESYFQQQGCPAKYLPDANCKASASAFPWEKDSKTRECLNQDCLGILGQIYSYDFLIVSRSLSTAVVGCIAILLGAVSMIANGVDIELRGSSKNKYYGASFGLVFMIFLLAQCTTTGPIPETYTGDVDTLMYSNFIANHPNFELFTNLQASNGMPMNFGDDVNNAIMSFVMFQTHKSMILQMTPTFDNVTILSVGDEYYPSYYNEVSKLTHALALNWIQAEDKKVLFLTFYVAKNAGPIFDAVYDGLSSQKSEWKDETIGLVVTRDLQDLVLENVMQTHLRVFQVRHDTVLFGFTSVPKFSFPYPDTSAYDNRQLALPSSDFDSEIARYVNEIRSNGGNNYVSVVWEDGKWAYGKAYSLEFSQVRSVLLEQGPEEPVILFWNFHYEGIHHMLCLVLGTEFLQDNQIETLVKMIPSLNEVGISFYPTPDNDFFDLDILVNYAAIPDPQARIDINNKFAGKMSDHLNSA